MHLPRSVFSRKQLDLFLWLLRVNRVDDVPSVKSMTLLNKIMQNLCGVDTIAYKGKQGHVYHVNNIGQLLAQVCFLRLMIECVCTYLTLTGDCQSSGCAKPVFLS